jgi:hypothetical protein
MVDVAQLVEPRIVIPAVAGSSPVVHPTLDSRFIGSAFWLACCAPTAHLCPFCIHLIDEMCPTARRQSASAKPQLMY